MSYKLLLKNKATKEKFEIEINEFKYLFKQELHNAIQAYIYHSSNRCFFPWKPLHDENDFYFDLRYNFNNYTNTNWYIEKIY